MGSFNRTGFISHLPITCGDEIVVFLLFDTTKIGYFNSVPIGIDGTGYVPVCLPFFGTYDDGGGIENVVDDFNSRYFQEKVGISIEEFSKKLHRCNQMSLNDIANKINEIEVDELDKRIDALGENSKTKLSEWEIKHNVEQIAFFTEMSEYFKRMLNIHFEGLGKKDLEMYVEHQRKEFYDSSIVFTMELKSVYDKMVELGRNHFYEDFWIKPKYKIDETFDNTNKFIQKVGVKMENVNPFTFGIYLSRLIAKSNDINVENDEIFEPSSWFSYYTLLGDTVTCGTLDYRLYYGCQQDISDMKEDAIKYAYFMRMMHHMCVVFALSPYHNQTVDYNRIVPLYQFMADYINKVKEEYDSNM